MSQMENEVERLLNELLSSFADLDDEAMIPIREFMRGVGEITGVFNPDQEVAELPAWESVGWLRARIRERFAALALGLAVAPPVVDRQTIEQELAKLVTDEESASEVYSALYNIGWVEVSSSAQTYEEASDQAFNASFGDPVAPFFTWGWRDAAGVVADARGRGENYMDIACEFSGHLGVSVRVGLLMRSLGLRPVS